MRKQLVPCEIAWCGGGELDEGWTGRGSVGLCEVGSDGAQDEGTETGEGGDLARVIVAWLFVHMSSCCSCVRGVIWHIPSDMY